LDLRVRKKRYAARVANVMAAVEERGHVTGRGTDSLTAEWFVPDVEEVAERVRALDR
jgi:hypothetical protein